MTLTPRELLEQDRALEALESAKLLPDDDTNRKEVEQHLTHVQSQEAYREYYRTMRGGVCPEAEVFTRHHFVRRFSSIRRLILERKHRTVLDLGCLDGWQLLNLASQGVAGVGVDLCEESLGVARARARKWGFHVRFVEAPIDDGYIEDIDLSSGDATMPKAFDAVILSEVLEHVLDPLACLRTAVRYLGPNGIVYISVPASPIPHHGKLEDAREHLRVFSEAQLTALAKEAGLAVTEDHEVIEEEDQGQAYSHRMISFRRARISIYCNHVTGGWNPEEMDHIGASEEMVVKVSEALVRAGHEVKVHQNGYEGTCNGVAYVSRAVVPGPDRDLLVLYKTLDHSSIAAHAKVFWTTDLPQSGQAASFLPPAVTEKLDAVLCISEYHRTELLKAVPWLDPRKTRAHWLGVDRREIADALRLGPVKVPGRVVYASSLDRGLTSLLDAWPGVREAVPHATLKVLYGFDFWRRSEAILPAAQANEMRRERERLEHLMDTLPGVSFKGRLPRQEFLSELAAAQVWAYPCTGGELCCKTALEVQASRCLPVVIPTMAVDETVQVGIKTNPESFAKDLITALLHPADQQATEFDSVALPSWDDLATFVWQAAPAVRSPENTAQRAVTVPTDAGAPEPVPDSFVRPHRTGSIPATARLDIVMAVAGMPFDGNTDRERGLGGSETAALQLSRELAKRGHRVSVFSNLPGQPGKFDGVSYLPLSEWNKYAGSASHDVAIVQREPMAFSQQLRSKLNVLWCHDLGLQRYRAQFRASLWNVDYVVPVSHWHGRQLMQVYELPAQSIVPMRNGIDRDMVAGAISGKRMQDRKALVYASRPERGLDLLLQSVFPRLLERDPGLVLYVTGYENTTPEMVPFYQHCQQLMAGLGSRVKWLGGLSKPDLYRLYSRARCLLYPSRSFEEVSCITVMEAAACGLPVVASALGALSETTGLVPGSAVLVQHPGQADEGFVSAFVDEAWRVISDDIVNARMSRAGLTGAGAYSWAGTAEAWEDFMFGALEARSSDRRRLVRHWWRLGDLNGLRELPEEDQVLLTAGQLAELNTAPADSPPTDIPDHVVQAVAQMARNAEASVLTNLAIGQDALTNQVAAFAGAASAAHGADFVFGIETLDCSVDPVAHIRQAEQAVKPNGHVCLVIASPGVHQDRLHRGAIRRARWVFDNQDMRELLQGKTNLASIIIGGGTLSEHDKQPLSWMLYQWQVSEVATPRKPLDIARRTRLQAPRPSLSACLIVKNAESMLHRCLKSIRPYCDEILVDDNGSTDSTGEILGAYGIEPHTGPSPITAGFDEARNQVLARATGDFVLWIDADEELLNASRLPKYLRWSMFHGFGVSQHHFSVEPPNVFKPDLPVRIFRRTNIDGSPTGVRFFGFVHEHPERAINESVGQSVILSDVHIAHEGYLTEEVRRKRFDRNIPLMFRDRHKYPDRVLGKYLMIRDWCHLARYSLERHGGQLLTPEAASYLEAAVESYRRDFLGNTHVMAMDGLQYYNEALRMLGRGFKVQVSLKVDGLGGEPRGMAYEGHVASTEDLQQLLDGGVRDLASQWQGKYL